MNIGVPQKFVSWSFLGTAPASSFSSSLPENKGAWVETTNYAKDDFVNIPYLSSYKQSSENDFTMWYIAREENTGINPVENEVSWKRYATDNKTAFLDRYIDSQTVSLQDEKIQIQITADKIDTIACFNVDAKYVVLQYDNNTIVKFLKEEETLFKNKEVVDASYKRSCLFEIPLYANLTYTLTFSNADYGEGYDPAKTSIGYVKIGKIIHARTVSIGDTSIGAGFGMDDRTIIEQDETGHTYIDKNKSYKETSLTVLVPHQISGAVFRYMDTISGIPLLWWLNGKNDIFLTYGVKQDFDLVYSKSEVDECSLSIKGL